MKKFLVVLLSLLLTTGCSCSMNGLDDNQGEMETTNPSEDNSNVTNPSVSPEEMTTYNTSDFIDYLANEYALENPSTLDNLDSNLVDGYSFGLNNQMYYLVQLDPNNEMTSSWRESILSNGQIDVDIEGLPQYMYGMLNGNYALISESQDYMDGFKEYYDSYSRSTNTNPEAPNSY